MKGKNPPKPPKAPKAPKTGKGKNKMRILVAAVVIAAVGWFAFFRGGEEEVQEEQGDGRIPAPVSYALGGMEVAALPALDEHIVVYPVLPEEPEGDEAASEDGEDGEEEAASEEEEPPTGPFTYRYQGLTAPGALTGAYASLLATADAGFYVADEYLEPTEPPDFQRDSGTVVLARMLPTPEEPPPAEIDEDMTEDEKEVAQKRVKEEAYRRNAQWEKSRLTLSLTWDTSSCLVTAEVKEVPQKPRSGLSGGTVKLSVPDANAYIQTLSPAAFGLEGGSMTDYRVYVSDGTVMVNGLSCLRINICRTDNNELAGNYFLSADRRVIYEMDAASGTVELLPAVPG